MREATRRGKGGGAGQERPVGFSSWPPRLGCLLVLASADDLPSFFCAYLSPPFQVKAARRRVRFVDGHLVVLRCFHCPAILCSLLFRESEYFCDFENELTAVIKVFLLGTSCSTRHRMVDQIMRVRRFDSTLVPFIIYQEF